MRAHGCLPAVLRALAGRDPAFEPDAATDADLRWLIRSGVGPLVWWLVEHSRLPVPEPWREPLQSSELVSRLRTRELLRTVQEVVDLLGGAGIECTLLKGIGVATRYYPMPHLRVMGDADLLIPGEALETGVRLLRDQGFTLSTFAAPEWWDTHHHAPPLTHPERGVTIELHHALLPPNAAAATDPTFDLATIDAQLVESCLGAEPVRRLVPECELALLAAAWANDLSIFLGRPGLQRPLLDAVVLLGETGDRFDWDRLIGGTAGTFTGTCVWTLLSVLERYGARPCRPEVLRRLRAQRHGLGPATRRTIHHVIHRHVMNDRPFGRILTAATTATVVRTLLARGPAWHRWLAVPPNMMFPPLDERRFQIGFQLRRIGSLLKAR